MEAGARVIHVDVMDGHFVPPISIGALVVEALRSRSTSGAACDVHLMVERPEQRVAELAAAGADPLIVHWEATPTCTTRSGRCGGGLHAGWRSTRPPPRT